MDDAKVVNIKTAEERIHPLAIDDKSVWCNAYFDEVQELRAALEASKEKLERLNGLYHSEVSKHQLDYNALQAENAKLKEDLQFVERWANHHAAHPNISAKEALSVIQHYPSIEEITKSYKDGVIPNTRNPYAEIESQAKRIADLESEGEISGAVVEKCSNLLAEIAITIKGHPKELARHSYHDLPELVLVLHVENELNKHRILEQSDEIEAIRKQKGTE